MYRSRVSAAKKRFASKLKRTATLSEKTLRRELNKTGLCVQFQSIVLGYVLDFYVAKYRVAIEVDGSSHDTRKAYDENRDAVLRKQLGIITLRFANEVVLSDVSRVIDSIERFCASAPVYRTWNEGRKKR